METFETKKLNLSLRILLVEDEPIVQRVHIAMLKKIGCSVCLAENGMQVFEKSLDGYDLIFMDMELPDLKGTEITIKIREYEKDRKQTPIVFLTAFTQQEIINECLESGANAVYHKPINIKKLNEIILQYVL